MAWATRMDYYPDSGYEVALLANVESVANLVGDHIADMILRLR